MALFQYIVYDKQGRELKGKIDAHNKDSAIQSLQSRGYIISSIKGSDDRSFLEKSIVLGGVSNKEIVILSKQLATLFDAQVSAIRIFRMLAEESKNEIIRNALIEIADDISDGSSVANAMAKHPKVFSSFYVNMIAAGEESGKMSRTFNYLSDYLERTHAITSKVKGAMIYPMFVMGVFVIVMYLMLTMVIPKISEMLVNSGNELPTVTKIVIGISDFLVDYGFIFLGVVVLGGIALIRYIKTPPGKASLDAFKIEVPLMGKLFRELMVARVSGNLTMMLRSGVAMVKAIEGTSKVVDNVIYEKILLEVADDVRGGRALSEAFQRHPEFSSLLVQMVKVGEESGKLSDILDTMAKFYEKEVLNRVSALTSLIEPIMITALGGGVGLLLSSVLLPIYSVTNSAL